MDKISQYLETLKQVGIKKLNEYFDIDKLNFSDFEIINSFLIYQAVNENFNLLIHFPNKSSKSQFYIPVIITISLYEFIRNINIKVIYKEGDILQKNGFRYEILSIKGDTIELIKRDEYNTLTSTNINNLRRNYILTTGDLTSRKVKTKFNTYKNFFTNTLNLDDQQGLPSKFKYKSIIITDLQIVDELKSFKINGEEIHKAFPFQYITSTGNITDNIPIDPMIYIVNDYETAKNYILNKGIEVKNIIFIGATKYEGKETQISNDLANKIYDNAIFIGSYDLPENSIPNLHKWKWTLAELNHFKYIKTKEIKIIVAENKDFEEKFNELYDTILKIEKENGINLQKIFPFIRKLFPIVIPNENSRLIKQLDNLLDTFIKEGEDIIAYEFLEIGEFDYDDAWEEILDKYKELIELKKKDFSKFNQLQQLNRVTHIVVPKDSIDIWKEETTYKIINFSEFKQLKKNYTNEFGNLNVVFLGFYGYQHLKEIIYPDFNITLLLNSFEKQSYEQSLKRLERENHSKIIEGDRKKITGISFSQTKTEESISELLKRLFDKKIEVNHSDLDETSKKESYLTYKIDFEDETIILEENKTVILKTQYGERPEKVKFLKVGDKIRVYENTSKEKLYKIALNADKEGIFSFIEEMSNTWKLALKNYYEKNFNSIEEFLYYLQNKGLSIKNEQTLRKWINIESDIKFPQKKKDLNVIRKVVNEDKLNENYKSILEARAKYNGIMIAIGRDFSDEIIEYVLNKKKGKILKKFSDLEIKEIINNNAPLKTIKSIKLVDDEN